MKPLCLRPLGCLSGTEGFYAGPPQRFLSVGEGAHCEHFAIAHRVDVRQAHILPLITALRSNSRMNQHERCGCQP